MVFDHLTEESLFSIMASSFVFPTPVFSFKEPPSAGRYMGCHRSVEGSIPRSTNVRFRQCFKVRATAQEASAGAEGISEPRQMKSKTSLYEVLEISPAATLKDVKRAYRKLAKEFHPDRAPSPQEKNWSTQMFLRIQNAYVTLSDPHDRAQYDRQLSAQVWEFSGQACTEVATGEPVGYTYSCGRVGRSWETDQCW